MKIWSAFVAGIMGAGLLIGAGAASAAPATTMTKPALSSNVDQVRDNHHHQKKHWNGRKHHHSSQWNSKRHHRGEYRYGHRHHRGEQWRGHRHHGKHYNVRRGHDYR